MRIFQRGGALSSWLLVPTIAACGLYESNLEKKNLRSSPAPSAESADSSAAQPRLAHRGDDEVVSTLVIPFGDDQLALTNSDGSKSWTVDMEEREKVAAGVAPSKYLKVKGELTVPANADNRDYAIGCLYVELKDNVLYRDQTWLRLATTGIRGETFGEVELPLLVDMGGAKPVPTLDDSITLATFNANSLKKFTGTLCFNLDFSAAPAQTYGGEIVVQYLRRGSSSESSDYNADTSDLFSCASAPVVLKAKQSTQLSWRNLPAGTTIEIKLAADAANYAGKLGELSNISDTGATYTAPASVPENVRILATARPIGTESLPAFCEVHLTGDGDIGVADDGEVQGLPGNVFPLPVNTASLPNLDLMTPVAHVVAANLDIPERSFSAGFPGVRDMFEWFAIRFKGQILIPSSGTCKFKLTSDDGANLYIDGAKVIDNDGVHATATKTGSANLTAGSHDIRVDYYQGPRYYITLQLFWMCSDMATWQIIPPSAFTRPLQ